MKKKKMLGIVMLILVTLLMFTGCAKEDEGLDIDVEDDAVEEENEDAEEEDKDVVEEDTEEENGDTEEEGAIEEEKEGKFVGWIDTTSFELDVDGETFAIRNDDNIEIPENLDGKNVRVKYRKNDNDQNIITSIETIE